MRRNKNGVHKSWKKLYDYCYNANSVTITYQG